MKIAIFGDSYADYKQATENRTMTWSYKLEQEHEAVNFSQAGSSLEWSYYQLNSCEEIDSFDKIIFIASMENRLSVHEDWYNEIHRWERHIPGSPFTCDDNSRFYKKHLFPAAKNYYSFFNDNRILQVRQRVYLESLRNRFKNKILILSAFNVFHDNRTYIDNPKLSLQQIYDIETQIIFDTSHLLPGIGNKIDARPCHLTKENHEWIFSMINNWIINHQRVKFLEKNVRTKIENIKSYRVNG